MKRPNYMDQGSVWLEVMTNCSLVRWVLVRSSPNCFRTRVNWIKTLPMICVPFPVPLSSFFFELSLSSWDLQRARPSMPFKFMQTTTSTTVVLRLLAQERSPLSLGRRWPLSLPSSEPPSRDEPNSIYFSEPPPPPKLFCSFPEFSLNDQAGFNTLEIIYSLKPTWFF